MYTGHKVVAHVTIQKTPFTSQKPRPRLPSNHNRKYVLNILGDGPLGARHHACRHTHACGGDDGGAVSAAAAALSLPINACAGGEVALREWVEVLYGSELGMSECTVVMQRGHPEDLIMLAQAGIHQKWAPTEHCSANPEVVAYSRRRRFTKGPIKMPFVSLLSCLYPTSLAC